MFSDSAGKIARRRLFNGSIKLIKRVSRSESPHFSMGRYTREYKILVKRARIPAGIGDCQCIGEKRGATGR